MATPPVPVDKISLIGIWVETVLYGVNCVVYGLSMFTLLRDGKIPALRWVLLVLSTTLFLLCTVHVGASLQQLLDAFVYAPAAVPDHSATHWLLTTTTLRLLKNTIYDTLVLTQDLILIWRLYVASMYDWKVVVFPIMLEVGCIGSAYAASQSIDDATVNMYGSFLPSFSKNGRILSVTALVLNITLNVSITTAIAIRLWLSGRTMASLTATRTNGHIYSIHIIVESGAMFAATSIALLVLYASNSFASSTALDIASQLAALTPLLIVVRVGYMRRNHAPVVDSSRFSQDKFIVSCRAGDSGWDPDVSLQDTLLPSPSVGCSVQSSV